MGSATSSDEVFLAGASAAVTGGGSGIGRAIALHLARAGARVAVGDVDVTAAEAVAAEAGGDAFAVALDIADRHQFAAFLDTAEQRHGPLRAMVNTAGVDRVGPFHEEPDEVTRREIDVNLYGTTIGSKLALKRMPSAPWRTSGQHRLTCWARAAFRERDMVGDQARRGRSD